MTIGAKPFFAFPLQRLVEVVETAAVSLRTLPPHQLRAEREALRSECAGAVGVGPAALLLGIYAAELQRRGIEP